MHVLIVTHFFPPQNAIASLRPYSFAKLFSQQGIKVTVITTKKNIADGNLDLILGVIPGLSIIELDYTPLFFWKKKETQNSNFKTLPTDKIYGKKSNNKIRITFRSIADSFGSLLDHQLFWVGKAFKVALDIHKENKVDVMISTFSPMSTHIIASKIKKKYPDIKWIADFRDLWSLNHIMAGKGLINYFEKLIEKRIIQNADYLTTVSNHLANQLEEFFEQTIPVEVIYNGYNGSINFTQNNGLIESKPVRILYTGTIYSGRRDPSPLLKALSELKKEGVINSGDFIVEFYGSLLGNLEEIIEKNHGKDWAILKGHLPHHEMIAEQSKADLLLFLESNKREANGVLTGKLFEYIAAGKPVMAVGIDEQSAAAQLIRSTKTGVVFNTDVKAIKEFIKTILKEKKCPGFEPDVNVISEYSREKQGLKLLAIAKKLINIG